MFSQDINIVTIVIIALTAIVSFAGFNDENLFRKYMFNTYMILKKNQWYRILSSALLHGDFGHLIFNMYTLYAFSGVIIETLGVQAYLVIYILSVVSGGLLSLLMHRRNPNYNAIGASGGVVGILYAAIALYPDMTLGLFFIIPMKGWVFGVLYLLYSVYGMKRELGNIGHDAHFGGAIAGLLVSIILVPEILSIHTVYIGLMLIPIAILIGLAFFKKESN